VWRRSIAGGSWSLSSTGLPALTDSRTLRLIGTFLYLGSYTGVYRASPGIAPAWVNLSQGLGARFVSQVEARNEALVVRLENDQALQVRLPSGGAWVKVPLPFQAFDSEFEVTTQSLLVQSGFDMAYAPVAGVLAGQQDWQEGTGGDLAPTLRPSVKAGYDRLYLFDDGGCLEGRPYEGIRVYTVEPGLLPAWSLSPSAGLEQACISGATGAFPASDTVALSSRDGMTPFPLTPS
jgi:hypothetical protein